MIEESPLLDSLLSNLNRDQLRLLLLKLVAQEPSLVEAIKREVTSLFPNTSDPTNISRDSTVSAVLLTCQCLHSGTAPADDQDRIELYKMLKPEQQRKLHKMLESD